MFDRQKIERAGFEEALHQMRAAVVIAAATLDEVIFVNTQGQEMLERYFGRSEPSELGDLRDVFESSDFESLHPDGRSYEFEEWPLMRSIRNGEEVRDEEIVHLLADGSRFTVRCDSSPIYDEGRIAAGVLVMHDVTEQQRAEEERKEAHSRVENILESITDAFFTVDRDWRYTYVNPAAERLGAKSREELIGKNLWEEFPEMAYLKFYREYHRAMDEGVSVQFEEYYPSPLEKWVDVKAYPSEAGLSVYARDITDRKKLEAEQQRLVGIVRNSSDFIGICDLDWQVTYVNEAGQSLVGLNGMEEVRRTTVLDYFAPEDRAFVQNEVMPTAMEKGRWAGERELELRHFETGEKIPVTWDIFRIDDPHTGEPISLATVTRDITERKRAEERLQESKRRNEDILESITDAFYAVDREWRLTYINERALRRVQRIKGEEIAREEIVGRNMWELYPETVGSVLYDKYHEAMREHKTVEFEVSSPLPPKEWLEVHVYPSEEGLSIYYRDITERKQAEERLQEANRRLEDLAVLKADFTAMVAHELDTPLAVISGYAALLAAGKLEPPARTQALARIQSETGVLKALVSDVRAAATVEREYFAIEPRYVPVDALLQDAAEFAATLPGDHRLTIGNAAGEERIVWADPDRIGQVLRNLLSNAAKYSPDGAPIELRAKSVETGVRIEVADGGAGVHPDDVPRVFEKFGRGRDRSGRKMAGAGLGLYLSRRIVLAHGGDLTLETAPGGGSVFGFDLESAR